MRLKITQPSLAVHSELACAVGWNVNNELCTCSDDQTIHKWNRQGQPEGKLCSLDTYFTDLHWYPLSSKKQQAGGTDVFAVACTDGTFKIISRTGRLEKSVEAHRGAVISLRWNYEGSALLTGGEDQLVKVWSRNGMLRTTVVQCESPVYAVTWGSDSDQLLYCSGPNITLRSLQSSQKQVTWKAHDGVVLKLDWSPINNLIISGAEDRKYKVWDSFGRLLFQSTPFEQSITSLAWSPTGDFFAVGSFNCLALCDKMGWIHSKANTSSGSILALSWTCDGTQVAGAAGSGAVVLGHVVEVSDEDGRLHATLEDEARVTVQDILGETKDTLDFRDRVVKMSLGFGQLIVATTTQCHMYSTAAMNTPHIFDTRDTVSLILQCPRSFLTVDAAAGIQIFTYEGRLICNPKSQGMRTDFMNQQMISLSNDTLAIMDAAGSNTVRFFETAQGRVLGEAYVHPLEVRDIALSQHGILADRMMLLVDRNRDLYLVSVSSRARVKLGGMVDSAVWHDTTPMLAAIMDDKLHVWYYPMAAYSDWEVLDNAKQVRIDSELGKACQLTLFTGSRVLLRRGDGAKVAVAVSPYPLTLHDLAARNEWDKATRLARFVRDPSVWWLLGALALEARQLHAGEAAFAAVDAAERCRYVARVKAIPTEQGRAAALLAYARRAEEAEALLLQAGLTYRAIKLHVRLHSWERALTLALKTGSHVDTVMWYRRRHLAATAQQESSKLFLQQQDKVQVDEATVRDHIRQEKLQEAQRPGAKPYI